MNWIEHNGGECPVEEGAVVHVLFRDGGVSDSNDDWWTTGRRRDLSWKHASRKGASGDDITAYKVIEL